jgi:hypothetical protein
MFDKFPSLTMLLVAVGTPSMLSAETLDFSALTKDGKMVVPHAAAVATANAVNFKYNVYAIGTNTIVKATAVQTMPLPKTPAALCGGNFTRSDDDQDVKIFGTRAGYVYTTKSNSVDCNGPTSGYKEDYRSYFYSANIATGASCVYAIRMKTTPAGTVYTNNVSMVSANEIPSQNGDAIKEVLITVWSPVVLGSLGSAIINPNTCAEIKLNTYPLGVL